MPYQVELREEINALISYISPDSPTDEELKFYINEVIRCQSIIIQKKSPYLYHLLVVEAQHYNIIDGLHVIRLIQNNKELNTSRKNLKVITLIVGQTPKSFQILITMMTRLNDGGNQVAVFATLEPALDFVRSSNTKNLPLE